MGGVIWDQRIRGGTVGVSATNLGPRKPAGLLGLVLHPLGPLPASWVLGTWEGGREEGGRGGEAMVGAHPPGPENQGRCGRHFPDPLSRGKSAGLPGQVPCPPRPPLGCVGPRGVGGREWGGRRREANGEGPSGIGGWGGHAKHIPCPLGPSEPAGVLDLVLRAPRPEALLGLSCYLKPKCPPPPGPSLALWVLSIGPANCQNPAPA